MEKARTYAVVLFSVLAATSPLSVGAESADAAKRIAEKIPGIDSSDITPAPIAGMYEIGLGTNVAYISADARYLLRGDIIDLESEVNLTEQRRSRLRLEMLDAVGEENMIVFAPEDGPVKHEITVFTDIDCGYCRKLHREMNQLNNLGIKVRYLFFPRSGPNTPSWEKAEAVWCAKDRNGALTAAKNGEEVKSDACGTTPIAAHWELVRSMSLRGTPAILTEDGGYIAGYVPAAQLATELDSQKKLSAAR